jgi:hypothetical protein
MRYAHVPLCQEADFLIEQANGMGAEQVWAQGIGENQPPDGFILPLHDVLEQMHMQLDA